MAHDSNRVYSIIIIYYVIIIVFNGYFAILIARVNTVITRQGRWVRANKTKTV